MSSMRNMAMQNVGRRVVVHSQYGLHSGVLHHVDGRGMYLSGARAMQVSGQKGTDYVPLTDSENTLDTTEVFWPLFFIPWLAAWALWPWGYWAW